MRTHHRSPSHPLPRFARSALTPILGIVAFGCGGDDEGTNTQALACENSIEVMPLGSVPQTEWPDGVAEGIDNYLAIGGTYSVTNSCGGGSTTITITTSTQELLSSEMDVITTPWPGTRDCGCLTDSKFPSDSRLNAVAMHDKIEFFIRDFDDPGVAGVSLVDGGSVVMYAPGDPVELRACINTFIDPLIGSAYETYTALIRMEPSGMTVDLVFATEEGEVTTCNLSGFSRIE